MSTSALSGVTPPRLLIVDDDPSILSQLSLALGRDFSVKTANNSWTAWELIRKEHPDLITLDLALDDNDPESGFGLLEKCLGFDPYMKVVLITGNDEDQNARRAIEQGAADFFGKPVDVQDLRVLLRRVLTRGRLERQNAELVRNLGEERRLGSILGQSPAMKALFRDVDKVAPVDVSVLVLGESGTGKEMVAKEIRRLSKRATKPFVSINCAAIPENLMEAELFGHEKGAFTSAHAARVGRLELADGGTVFLDEVGELPILLQVKLLRFLQDHQVERVGGREVIDLNVRVLAATSRNLEDEVRAGRFREDLYYRLCVVTLKLPPLRERGEDVLFLAQYFLDRYSNEFGKGQATLMPGARLAIQNHNWPGNVREMENKIQRAVLMASSRHLDARDLGLEDAPDSGRPLSLREARDEAERSRIIDVLRQTGGNISKAAQVLRISRPSLHELLTKQGIKAREYRARQLHASNVDPVDR